MRTAIPIIFALVMVAACGQPENVGNEPAFPADSAVVAEGREVIRATFQELSSSLQKAIEEGGVEHALKFCSVRAVPITDSLATHYGIRIRRASHRPRNPDNRADSLEMVSIENYLTRIRNDEELKPFVYDKPDGAVIHAPIRITGELCLNCHGRPGTDIAASDLEVIRRIYPEDEATGFTAGELRGIWSVRFPKSYFTGTD